MTPAITVHFIAPDASRRSVSAKIGKSLMEAAVAADVEGIAADCGGMLTCSTCHVRVQEAYWSRLPPADAEEQSMLDFTGEPATPNSRLSCQIILNADLDGLTVELPATQY